ncbi:MAG: DUF1887 family protein [Pseudanabaena sp. M090S1SP1A06QC]|jgi:hypothetical protein|nr:DUF1887 family protein [Pseudanabaena sp. M051S1SP2A07QC]MCA6616173.1 DUF1887 family protein [Pseudanabaena sp. M090S1SP1A06QC]MCA6624808.1 DUF1887 family protein [Pseudanabaena sp. M165S2SP1A06QC]
MNISELDNYKVDHLFLLMGENPLPNYIATISLLNHYGTAYLVHTKRTKLQAQRLQQVLAQLNEFNVACLIDLGDRQADAHYIWEKLLPYVSNLQDSIGLNYTGGTKPMSVHAYRVIEHLYPSAIFSYLDANTLEIYFDNNQGESAHVKVSPQLSLSQMFQLHGLVWRVPPSDLPIRADLAAEFAKLNQNPMIAEAWKQWRKYFRSQTRNETQWKPETELRNLVPLSLRSLPLDFQSVLQNMGAVNQSLSLAKACEYGFPDCTNVCEWLDGIWLEHHVLAQVQTIAKVANIQECKMSFRIDERASQSRRWEKFEFDVAFIRNCQLFALSCTTVSDRQTCKQKLFEANTRARQLGGIETRVGLVCCNDYPESLRSELEVETRDRKFAVFGRQDLSNLGQKVLNWVKQNQ